MAKYKCPYCKDGYAHTSGLIPNSNELLYLSERTFSTLDKSIETIELYNYMGHIFRCVTENCDSILIFSIDSEEEPRWFNSYTPTLGEIRNTKMKTCDNFEYQVVSDVSNRDGIGIEIYEKGIFILEIFRDDSLRKRYITFGERQVDFELLETSMHLFKREIPYEFIKYED